MSGTIDSHSVPYLILHNQHPDLFQLFSKLFDIKTNDTIVDIYICAMIKYIQGACNINLQ